MISREGRRRLSRGHLDTAAVSASDLDTVAWVVVVGVLGNPSPCYPGGSMAGCVIASDCKEVVTARDAVVEAAVSHRGHATEPKYLLLV